jgi:iron complex transport system substrate-binding protein
MLEQFNAAAMTYAVIADWMEGSSVASLEWIKFIAAFYNLDEEADRIYEHKIKRLEELSVLAADIPENERPLVAYGNVYRGVVYAQGSDSTVAVEYGKSGGRYYLKDIHETGTVRISIEEFISLAKEADILMYTSMILYTPDKKALLAENPLFAELKAFKNDRIYVQSKGYYMNGAALDVKIEDTAAIFHPELFPDRKLTFYTRLPD